ncbi:PTS sugar transporter subunit IIA [Halonatronum saccharophilum]|uniref:PTS sugar transporter subunit IIA n=1 Tax=Halonatronum saccharophilum TaxID=150060 RepID=UPI000480853D|nr:fructose PTS transporter subunit IIA [Halonatronum saccharophilum]
MKISNLLAPDFINLDLNSTDKESVLEELVHILDDANKITSKEEFYKVILAREELSTTGVGNQVAIPHGKSSVVKEASLVFGRSDKGIDFGSFDEKPAKLFFMIAVPEGSSDEHLKVLAQLSRKLMHEDFRNALLKAKDTESLLKVIKDNE